MVARRTMKKSKRPVPVRQPPDVMTGHNVGMDTSSPTFYADLLAETTLPARGILSQTLSKSDGIELVLFAFAAGEALTEHTSSRPAIMHILAGEGDMTVAGEPHEARPGTWVRMPSQCKHSITARTPLVMALYLLPPGASAAEG
jgi:quercetin dioxygenase-like cupin family protein